MNKNITVAVLCLGLFGCQQKPETNLCWSPETKKTVTDLSTSVIQNAIYSEILLSNLEGPKSLTAEQKSFVNHALSVVIDTFHVKSRDGNIQSLQCGASVSMKYTLANGVVLEANNASISFGIYPGEKEMVYSIDNIMPLKNLVEEANSLIKK